MSELQQLMQNSIPCARGVLQENYKKLLEVADYCESNYVEVSCSMGKSGLLLAHS